MSIKEQIESITTSLPKGVKLVAVSKTHPIESLQEAYSCGQRIFGENRPQEMLAKSTQMADDVEWHMIGHLQTNKVRMIAPIVSMIHSVDSERLLNLIDKEATRVGRTIKVLMEVYVAQEQSKSGWDIEELRAYAQSERWKELKSVEICGLMGIATNTDDMIQVASEFSTLNELKTELQPLFSNKFTELSMGMSDDYQLAIEHGSSMVRIGSTIFGYRDYK